MDAIKAQQQRGPAAAAAAKAGSMRKRGSSSSAAAAAAAAGSSSSGSDSDASGSDGSDSETPGENLPSLRRNLRVIAIMLDDKHYRELSMVEEQPDRERMDSGLLRKKHPAWKNIAKDARSTVRRTVLLQFPVFSCRFAVSCSTSTTRSTAAIS